MGDWQRTESGGEIEKVTMKRQTSRACLGKRKKMTQTKPDEELKELGEKREEEKRTTGQNNNKNYNNQNKDNKNGSEKNTYSA